MFFKRGGEVPEKGVQNHKLPKQWLKSQNYFFSGHFEAGGRALDLDTHA